MFQAARNDYPLYLPARQRGIALLVMVALILVAFTTIAISKLSINSGEQKARARTTQALIQSRDAIMAYALAPSNLDTTPPGVLPCPDTDGDGESNPKPPSTAQCQERGLVPFITLGIPQPLDGTGAPIWYVVSRSYTGSPSPMNSSLPASLQINSQPAAFILLAPNVPLGNQNNRPALQPYKNPPAATFAQFLEITTAGTNPVNYISAYGPDKNDQVLSITTNEYWTGVEAAVMAQVKQTFTNYFTSCPNAIPNAVVPFGTDGDAGVINRRRGGLPFDLISTCPTATPFPDWFTNHWSRTFYYAACVPNCISLQDASGANVGTASVIVITPGVQLTGSSPRIAGPNTIANYFELENADELNDVFTKIKSDNQTPLINDRVYVIR